MRPLSILRRQNPLVLGVAAVALALMLCVGYMMAATRWPWIFDWGDIRQANKVIASVNAFQSRNGRLPNTLADMGLEESESGPVYYRKTSDRTYIVWFGTILGESATYESSTKKWR